jgi:hypothetical protein
MPPFIQCLRSYANEIVDQDRWPGALNQTPRACPEAHGVLKHGSSSDCSKLARLWQSPNCCERSRLQLSL